MKDRIDNYIFDLYGTLIDIRTDEAKPLMWYVLSELYRRYGTDLPAEELRQRFLAVEKAARRDTAARMETLYPEIKLETVFARLLVNPEDESVPIPEPEGEDLAWAGVIANTFRTLSIRRIDLYEGACEFLDALHAAGKRVYLLSNAQKIFTMPEIVYLGLKERFDAIYISSDYDICKPDPYFMKRLLEGEGLDPKASAMVGNEPGSDMGVALLTGVHGILYNTGKRSMHRIEAELKNTASRYPGIAPDEIGAFMEDMVVVDALKDIVI